MSLRVDELTAHCFPKQCDSYVRQHTSPPGHNTRETAMGDRYTVKDVRRAAEALEPALRKAGMLKPTDRLILSEGSKTYGRAYRLNFTPEGQSGHYSLPIHDYLGMTAAEAVRTLSTMRESIGATLEALERSGRLVKGD